MLLSLKVKQVIGKFGIRKEKLKDEINYLQ